MDLLPRELAIKLKAPSIFILSGTPPFKYAYWHVRHGNQGQVHGGHQVRPRKNV